VPTGFADLDRLTAGLQPGNLIVISPRPSTGKTTLAVDFARSAAVRAGVPTLICSLELNRHELVQRLSCAERGVDLQRFRTGRMDETDWRRLTDTLGRLDFPRQAGHRGYATMVDGSESAMTCWCSHSMGDRYWRMECSRVRL
jgi:replicative DNA helicase